MKRFAWLALAGLLITGCGADTTLPPTEDHAAPWVGEYEGTGDFWLSNGVEGSGQPIAITIAQVDPKHITVAALLTFGSGRNDFVEEVAMIEPDNPTRITLESRFVNSKTVFSLALEGDTLTGSIVVSTARIGGTWTQDERMTSIVASR